MYLVSLQSLMGEQAIKETRTVTVPHGHPTLPRGQYAFMELYCDDPNCDCRRVTLKVISAPPNSREWATIGYGWESDEFYLNWSAHSMDLGNPFLDPLNPQSQYSAAFLEFARNVLLQDEAYVARLIRHYEFVKGATRHESRQVRRRRARRRPPGFLPHGG